jgi:hypothetical protein
VAARSKAPWDCGFKYLRGNGRLCLLRIVCCQVDVSASGGVFVQRIHSERGEAEGEATIMKKSWPTKRCCTMENKKKTCLKIKSR